MSSATDRCDSPQPYGRRVFLALAMCALLLPVTSPASGSECPTHRASEVPDAAGVDGTPLAISVTLTSCAATLYDEARVWLGNETHQASRLHDGEGWTTSQHYAPLSAFSMHNEATIIALQANPDATHAPPLVEHAETTTVWMRLRGQNTTSAPVPLGEAQWVGPENVHPYWGEADDPWVNVRRSGGLLGAAPGFDEAGSPYPTGFARIALPPQEHVASTPPVVAGDLLLVRVGPHLHEDGTLIEFLVQGSIRDLAGTRVVSRGGELILPSLEVSSGTLVRLMEPDDTRVAPLAVQVPHSPLETVTIQWGDRENEAQGDAKTAKTSGRFNLAQSGGFVELHYGDQVLDSFAYGDSDTPQHWQGEAMEATRIDRRLFLREWTGDGIRDEDQASDWQRPRVHRQHQSDQPSRWFHVEGPVRAFLCPDRCHEEVMMRIEQARKSIDVNLYELTLPSVVTALADAADRGVSLRVLIHDRPVAASQAKMDRIAWSVDQLVEAGADVRTLEKLRYDVNHAKYLIIDEQWSLVSTENAVGSGWPPDGQSGNRGHGVAIYDGPLAMWMQDVFGLDHQHPEDAIPVTGKDLHPDAQGFHPPASALRPAPATAERIPTLVVDGGFDIAPVLAPDHLGDPALNPIVTVLNEARRDVGVAQMNLPLYWSRPGHIEDSPLATALVDAAERDVAVTGILASAFIQDLERDGNHRTAAALKGTNGRIDLRLGGAPHPDGVVHAKTWWSDPGSPQAMAITGSANGNLASQAMNREVNVLIAHPEIAAYWAKAGERDHRAAEDPARFAPPGDDVEAGGAQEEAGSVAVAGVLPLVLVLILASARASRRAWPR